LNTCKVGLVIGSADCIDKELTNILLDKCLSIGINRAATDYQTDFATTSEESAAQNWMSLGVKAKQFILPKSFKCGCFNDSNTFFYIPKKHLRDCANHEDLFYGQGNSAFPAIHYLLKQNCETIILSGIAFDSNWGYYYNDIQKLHDKVHCELIKLDLYRLAKYANFVCINKNNFNSNSIQTINSEISLFNLVEF
jgi:hypothetical protein